MSPNTGSQWVAASFVRAGRDRRAPSLPLSDPCRVPLAARLTPPSEAPFARAPAAALAFVQRGETPLSVACQHGHVEAASVLLNAGADVSLCDKARSPLCQGRATLPSGTDHRAASRTSFQPPQQNPRARPSVLCRRPPDHCALSPRAQAGQSPIQLAAKGCHVEARAPFSRLCE